jgi:hypothetical protein
MKRYPSRRVKGKRHVTCKWSHVVVEGGGEEGARVGREAVV